MKIENRQEGDTCYFCALDDDRQVGEANYYNSPGCITITHVGVDPDYRGKGLAKDLVMSAVDYARDNQLKIIPLCSYSRAVFDRYDEELADVLFRG